MSDTKWLLFPHRLYSVHKLLIGTTYLSANPFPINLGIWHPLLLQSAYLHIILEFAEGC